MIKRQPAYPAIAGAVTQAIFRNALKVRHHRAMGDGDALWRSGGARRELKIGEVIRADHRPVDRAARFGQFGENAAEDEVQRRHRLFHPVGVFGGGEDGAGARHPDDAAKLCAIGLARTESDRQWKGRRHQPGDQRAAEGAGEIGVGLRQHADPVARREAQRQQPRRRLRRLIAKAAIAEPVPDFTARSVVRESGISGGGIVQRVDESREIGRTKRRAVIGRRRFQYFARDCHALRTSHVLIVRRGRSRQKVGARLALLVAAQNPRCGDVLAASPPLV